VNSENEKTAGSNGIADNRTSALEKGVDSGAIEVAATLHLPLFF